MCLKHTHALSLHDRPFVVGGDIHGDKVGEKNVHLALSRELVRDGQLIKDPNCAEIARKVGCSATWVSKFGMSTSPPVPFAGVTRAHTHVHPHTHTHTHTYTHTHTHMRVCLHVTI